MLQQTCRTRAPEPVGVPVLHLGAVEHFRDAFTPQGRGSLECPDQSKYSGFS
jgi:hypothetical protein